MKKVFLTIAIILQALLASAQLRVEVPEVVSVNEQFNVSFVYDGEFSPSDFSWNPGQDFNLVWGPQKGQSTSVSIINGKKTKSSQFTYNYILMPKTSGSFVIPPATITLKGKGGTLTTDPVQVTVVKEGADATVGSQSQGSGTISGQSDISSENLFLRLTLDKTKVVVGEPVIATLKLYQRVNIAGFEDVRFPTFNGFWNQVIQAPVNIEFKRESIDDKIYNTALLRKFVLIPQQSGVLKIEPAELVCLVNVGSTSTPSASIFDEFFNEFRTVRKRVSTPEMKVQVSALPSGAPATFHGGVGEFSISAKLSKNEISTHEASSLIVSVSGRGNVSLLEAPDVVFPPDFEVYDTKVTEKTDKSAGGTVGTKIFEYPFIPRSAGEFELQPVKYTYYDISAGKYITIETPVIPFAVARGNETSSGTATVPSTPSVSRQGVKNINEDIRYINVKDSRLRPKGSFFVGSSSFWISFVLIFILAVIAYFSIIFLTLRRSDVIGAKTRGATKMARRRLKKAENFLKQNIYGGFYEELHKALVGYVSDKLNISPSDFSKESVAASLIDAGVRESTVTDFISVIDECEFARYSPTGNSDAMSEHFRKAVDVISILDSEMKSKKIKNKGKVRSGTMISIIFALIFSAPSVSQAQDAYVDSLWHKASKAYEAGQWQEAVSLYESISGLGLESAALYCNTGNAYFKIQDYPRAILYYEKSLKLDPSYSDARYNLKVASDFVQDMIDQVPEFILKTWSKDLCYTLDSNTWAVLALVSFAFFLSGLLLFLLSELSGLRKTGFFSAIIFLILFGFSIWFSTWQKSDYMNKDTAVIVAPVVSVKNSPSSETSSDLFILHDGTKVRVIDEVGNWYNIELSDGRQGWIQSKALEII